MDRAMTAHHGADTAQDRAGTAQDRPDFITVGEAARRLGVSPTTVKRRIARGTLEAEQLQRPQGFEYRVRLTTAQPTPHGTVHAPSTAPSDSEEPAPPTVTTQDVAAAITAATAPLLAVIERQAGEIAELREDRGRLTAELDILKAAHGPGASHLTAPATDSMIGPFPRAWAFVAGTLLAIAAVLVLAIR